MDVTTVIIVIVVLILILLLAFRGQSTGNNRPTGSRPGQAKPSTHFHAVSIKFVSSACEAAKAMEG